MRKDGFVKVFSIYLKLAGWSRGSSSSSSSSRRRRRFGRADTILLLRSTPDTTISIPLTIELPPEIRNVILVLILLRDQILQPLVLRLELSDARFKLRYFVRHLLGRLLQRLFTLLLLDSESSARCRVAPSFILFGRDARRFFERCRRGLGRSGSRIGGALVARLGDDGRCCCCCCRRREAGSAVLRSCRVLRLGGRRNDVGIAAIKEVLKAGEIGILIVICRI